MSEKKSDQDYSDAVAKRDRAAVRKLEARVARLEEYMAKNGMNPMEPLESEGASEEEVEKAKEQSARDREYLAERYDLDPKDVNPEPMLQVEKND